MGLLLLGHAPDSLGGIGPDRYVVPASPDAVVPALPLGLSGLHACAVTHCPPAQPMAALDFVGDDPDLVQGPYGHSAHVVGHMIPAGALRVAGCDPSAEPQVPWGEKQRVRAPPGVQRVREPGEEAPTAPSHPALADPWRGLGGVQLCPFHTWVPWLHNRPIVLGGAGAVTSPY